MPKTFFDRRLFQFLVELKFNNERTWFNANKTRYEQNVKAPMQAFIQAALPRLAKLNPAYVQGSFFRIYRDTRFSKDKTPYKTHAAAQFRHRAASSKAHGVHAPGFYFHAEPGECMVGGGIWMPEPSDLQKVRQAIAKGGGDWAKFKKSKMPLWQEEKLKRPPKGFDPAHPLIEDLKLKHYITWIDLKDKKLWQTDFLDRFIDAAKKIDPLVRFLCQAMGLK